MSQLPVWIHKVLGLSCHSFANWPTMVRLYSARKHLRKLSPFCFLNSNPVYINLRRNCFRLVICYGESSSSLTFQQAFDRLLLLARGGKTVFFGDVGENGHDMIEYFQRNGARTCDSHENPYVHCTDSRNKTLTSQ